MTKRPTTGDKTETEASPRADGVSDEAEAPAASDSLSRAAESLESAALSGVAKIGGGISNVGERIARLGVNMDDVPVVGGLSDGMTELGQGVSDVGASLTQLPQVARTKEGRLLFRSFFVGIFVIAAAFAAIIAWQIRKGTTPNLRRNATAVLTALSNRSFSQMYAEASPRLQEVTREATFVRQLSTMRDTVGDFQQIAAINDTIVTHGPSGTTARIELVADFSRGKSEGTVSLQRDGNDWRLLGLSLTLLGDLAFAETAPEARGKRVAADPAVMATVEATLTALREKQYDAIWQAATPVFQGTITAAELASLEAERRVVLGNYVRMLHVITNKANPLATEATVDTVVEFSDNIARAAFGLIADPNAPNGWRLNSYRLITPLPRVSRPVTIP